MDFEWDEEKRASNLRKHGLDFRDAALLLRGACVYRPARAAGAEERWNAVGILRGYYVAVIFTRRGEALRIISMRRARHGEKRDHHAAFGG